jgi:superfamily I DNA/RNA helicase
MEKAAAPYDCLVIDEAQDILSPGLADLLSEEVLDGLEGGRWRIFLDSNNQASIYGALDELELKRFASAAEKRFDLTMNCRNTKQIAIQTNIVSEPKNHTAALIAGPAVDFRTYRSDKQCASNLMNVIKELRAERIAPGRVSILFARLPDSDLARKLEEQSVRKLNEADVGKIGTAALDDLTWSTVSAYKGLENDVIVLVGIQDIENDWWRGITYVGMSRARVRLTVIVHSKCDSTRQKRFERDLERRLKAGEMIT